MTIWLDISKMRFRTVDGLSIRFAESEGKENDALLLSPWPESVYAFAPMWASLFSSLGTGTPGVSLAALEKARSSLNGMGQILMSISPNGAENPSDYSGLHTSGQPR